MKFLAERLGVRDSDIVRFGLKMMLNRLAGLCDPEIRGSNLVPTLVEAGPDFVRYFDLDAVRLDAIINAGAEPSRKVSHDDIALLSLAGSQPEYAMLRLRRPAPSGLRVVAGAPASVDALRQHLYDKYVYAAGAAGARPDPHANEEGTGEGEFVPSLSG
jgi:hypothetical protein